MKDESDIVSAETSESPEALLTRLSSKAVFKASKDLAKTGRRICGTRNPDGSATALFQLNKNPVPVTVQAKVNRRQASCVCSQCGEKLKTLCPHAFAALVYDFKYKSVRSASAEQSEIKYQGLQTLDYLQLGEKGDPGETPRGFLRVDVENDFPHIPSKWEKAVFGVTMNVGGRIYKGNISNIRQLHFDKSPATLRATDFSLQERQILRYLAVNAEADNSRLMLDSEQTAEFLHCLIGFPRFYQAGQRVVIHRLPAEPVLLISKAESKEPLFQSAIGFEDKLLPLERARVVTGRNGVWVGFQGEYFWIPGLWDVAWLRSFFHHAPQRPAIEEARKIQTQMTAAGIRVETAPKPRIRALHPDILLDCELPDENTFRLVLHFVYAETVYSADQARLILGGKRLACRDNVTESALIDALRYFGFEQPGSDASSFELSAEALPVFMTELLPHLCRDFPKIHLSGYLTNLAHPTQILPQFRFKRQDGDSLYLEVLFRAEGKAEPLLLGDLEDAVRQNRRNIPLDNGFAALSAPLLEFLRLVLPLLLPVKGHPDTYRVARANIPFWVERSAQIPGVTPQEFRALCERLTPKVEDVPELPEGITAPFEGTLRPYQSAGVEWILQRFKNRFNAILADEMGLGKTVQALALLTQTPHPQGHPHLIVCPTSLTENWRREAARFVPSFRTVVAAGLTRSLIWNDLESCDLVILSYAIVRRDIAELQKRHFTTVILDEAQHIKNPETANAKSCKAIPSSYRLVLTGTPLENSPEDLWSIFDFLNPNMLGPLSAFMQQFDNEAGADYALLSARLAPFMLRRRKAEVCTELPSRTEQTLYCELGDEQRRLYETYRLYGKDQCRTLFTTQIAVKRFEILTTLLRLRQICCHPSLLPDVPPGEPSAKTELLLELLSENIDSGHKILVFSQFTSLLSIIRQELDTRGIAYEYLDGQTKDRQERVDRFNQTPSIPVFLLSLKAGGTGLNLTGADTVVLYDPWWNPAVENQAADRSHRIGQLRPVNIIRLVAENTVEERILKLQEHKKDLFEELVEDPTRDNQSVSLSIEDIASLFND